MDGRAVGPEFLFKGLDIAADGPRRNADKIRQIVAAQAGFMGL